MSGRYPPPARKLPQCGRCNKEEDIATHQYVKFDDAVQYLCTDCWRTFRKWFFALLEYQ